jgi:putative ATPase
MQSTTLFPEEIKPEIKKENLSYLKNTNNSHQPLAFQMAPKNFQEYIGQSHILGADKPLRQLIEQDKLFSIILWGPPGCGKTSLSRLISKITKSRYISINAVTAKISDIKEAIEISKANQLSNIRTILFIDEIHRFNKVQQDALLPEVENGLITLIGATTENPFFSVIPGLISRSQVFELHPLSQKDLKKILEQTINKLSNTLQIQLEEDAKAYLINESQGDARKLLNLIEMASNLSSSNAIAINKQKLEELTQTKGTKYNTDAHYDLVSAYIKSMRGSDPDAAIYWLARMLKGGENPEFIARRLIIFASEDIGNADPMALVLATSLLDAVKFIGMPEVQINFAHVTTYLATAPKSNASYSAIKLANKLIEQGIIYPVPKHLKDSHYKGAKKMGFGKDYKYPHNNEADASDQKYMPQKHTFYSPKESGYEKNIAKRIKNIT